ncbi:MAG: lipoate--protein ligase family protein, partial [Candidatus Hodarchaeales archaeon]
MLSGRKLITNYEDVFFNLALEHAILQLHHTLPYSMTLRIWNNSKSVIIGRNQYINNEINIEYCKKYDITIARRISGGGAVYHDLGNLNISFFLSKKIIPSLSSVKEFTDLFTKIIIASLKAYGLNELEQEGFSNIFYKGKKISGSAGYTSKNWLLHHATLLVSANLTHLNNSLLASSCNPPPKSRGSRFFPTTNLPKSFDVILWREKLIDLLSKKFLIRFSPKTLTSPEQE